MTEHRRSSIVVVAEGDELGGASDIADAMRADEQFSDIELRVCILGHTQRGGAPSARDRVLASRLGKFAVETLLKGEFGVMVGVVNNELVLTPFDDIRSQKKNLRSEIIELSEIIS